MNKVFTNLADFHTNSKYGDIYSKNGTCITMDRHGGKYSKGYFVAMRTKSNKEIFNTGAFGDDIQAMEFWYNKKHKNIISGDDIYELIKRFKKKMIKSQKRTKKFKKKNHLWKGKWGEKVALQFYKETLKKNETIRKATTTEEYLGIDLVIENKIVPIKFIQVKTGKHISLKKYKKLAKFANKVKFDMFMYRGEVNVYDSEKIEIRKLN